VYRLLLAFSVAALIAAPATAQQKWRDISAAVGSPWLHAGSAIPFPARIAGFDRVRINDTGTAELDIVANYEGDEDILTIYLFKPQIVSSPLWMDRALDSIMLRPDFGMAGRARPVPVSFQPTDATNKSGLRAAFSIDHPKHKSTAVAVLPANAWLIKVRISSPNPDVARTDRLLSDALRELRAKGDDTAAQPISNCPSKLRYVPLKAMKAKGTDAFASVLGASLIGAAGVAPATYCRELPGTPVFGVYRKPEESRSYVVALADSGRAVSVQPSPQLAERARETSSVSLLDLGRTLVYGDFKSLPEPGAVVRHVLTSGPIAMTEFSNGKVNTTILSSATR
jgi:hypothetical protein